MTTTLSGQLAPITHTRRRFADTPESVGAARAYVRDTVNLHAPELAPGQVSDIQLLTSELVTNAVRYGTEPGDSILVAVTTGPDEVRIEVHDPARRRPRRRPPSDARTRGRGMLVVEALATSWGVSDRPLGKIVWAVMTR